MEPNTIFSQLTVTKVLSPPTDFRDSNRGNLPEKVRAANLMQFSSEESTGRTFAAVKILSLMESKGTAVETLAVLSCIPVSLSEVQQRKKVTHVQ